MVHDGRRPLTSSEPEDGVLIGSVLGSYRIVEQLGQGGMGEVYVGRHEKLGHRVAVKVLRLEMSRNADMVRRFFNEAQSTTAIRSPGIVQIFDFGNAPDGRAYFVMELLEGQSLQARLKQRRPDHVECCRIGRQVTNVLQAAHTAGITHRDLKPDNLFLVPDVEVVGGERVKVLDFGIAKLAGEVHAAGVKTRTDVVMGTPTYMSPEQSRGAGTVDARSDIYSLGCILFEMVCGRPPFIGEGAGGIIGAHQYVDPPQPRSLAPDVPPRLAKLILHMLAKPPEARPQTMAAVGQELEEILRALEKAPKRAAAAPPKRAPAAAPGPKAHAEATYIVPSPGMSTPGARGPERRAWIALGSIVLAVVVIGIVLGARGPGSEPTPGSGSATEAGSMTGPSADAARVAEPAVIATADAIELVDAAAVAMPPPVLIDAAGAIADTSQPAGSAAGSAATPGAELEIECLRFQADEKWAELDACADQLKATNPTAAKELKARATLETKAVPRINAFEAAIRDKNLKRAKAELDALQSATSYSKLKQRYGQAEDAAIRDLVTRLERAREPDCKKYNQLVQQEKASKPPRVAAEATNQVKCTPATPATPAITTAQSPKPATSCNAAALASKGGEQYAIGQLGAALASFEQAWACKQDSSYADKAFIIACNIPNLAKARLFWKRMPQPSRARAVMICVRNGIAEEQLNAP
jgi:serine/threonine-protein kinase